MSNSPLTQTACNPFLRHPNDDYYGHNLIEPAPLRHLANAVEALISVRSETEHEFVTDCCDKAIREVRNAIRHFTEPCVKSEEEAMQT